MHLLRNSKAIIYFEVAGQGAPVLFIQGIGVTGEGWRPQINELSKDFQTVILDNRGIGKSQVVSGGVTVAEMATDAFDLMDHLGWESAHLVGHSLGGIVAQEMALENSKRVRSLTLMCTFAKGKDGGKFTPWALWMFFRTRVGSRPMRRRAFLEMLFPKEFLLKVDRDILAEEVGKIVGRDLATTPAVLMKQFKALSSHNRFQELQNLKGIPTLVLSGAHDLIARPESGRALAAAIPGAKYVEFADASHGLPIHLVEKVNGTLREWLNSRIGEPGVN